MGEVSNLKCEPRPDIVCLEGNGSRPSHKGDGYRANGTEVHSVAYTFDARGNGNGDVTCTITGGHQSTISDYTAIVVEMREKTYEVHTT